MQQNQGVQFLPLSASNLLHSSLLQGGEGGEKFTIKLVDTPQVAAAMTSQRWCHRTNPFTPGFFLHLSLDHLGQAQTPKILDDGAENYLFRKFGAYPHPRDLCTVFLSQFPTTHTLLPFFSQQSSNIGSSPVPPQSSASCPAFQPQPYL